MIGKIGRNDSCPCGSGKKYKKCCAESALQNATLGDFSWRKLRQTEGHVVDKHLMPYLTKKFPKETLATALDDIGVDELPEELDKPLLFNHFVLPWILFDWIPSDDFGLNNFDPDLTIAENYLQCYADKLSVMESDFIKAMSDTYYSYYTILEIKVAEHIVVKDILLGTVHTVKEKKATETLKRGDIIFSRILTIDDQSIFIGMAPFLLPTKHHTLLLDFKQWLIEENDGQELNSKVLRHELDTALMDYFFDAMEAVFNPSFPTLVNTDGDLVEFCKSYFKLAITPQLALQKLLPLTLSKHMEDFFHDAKYNKAGQITRVELPWLKRGNKKHTGWDNTVMGNIIIDKEKLTLETNSHKRAQRGKKLLEKHLGGSIHFQTMLLETPEQLVKSSSKSPKPKILPSELNSPEMQAKMEQMAKRHWENWFNQPIPSLKNKTPREAIKTVDGKERLEALLWQYERHSMDATNNLLQPDISYLRKELGLDE